jgi:ABC-type uncharacterized transport system permease subunit
LLAGLGGGTLVLSGVNNFFDNLTAGRGFIAFSAIVFGKWTPVGTALATFLFGFIDAVQLRLQALSIKVVPYQFFLALPYITTMFALAIIGSARGPSASGIPYSREGH